MVAWLSAFFASIGELVGERFFVLIGWARFLGRDWEWVGVGVFLVSVFGWLCGAFSWRVELGVFVPTYGCGALDRARGIDACFWA